MAAEIPCLPGWARPTANPDGRYQPDRGKPAPGPGRGQDLMHRPALPWLLGLALSLCLCAAASAAPREITVKEEVLGTVTVLAPAEEPQIFAALLSDKDGFTPAYKAAAEKLVAGGAAVLLVDTSFFIDALDKREEEK